MFCTKCGAKFEQLANGQCPECQTTLGAVPEIAPAGFWVRAAAIFLDRLAVSAVNLVVVGVLAVGLGAAGVKNQGVFAVLWLVGLVINALYFIVQTTLYGQTLGKRVCGLKVTMLDGSAVAWGASIIRFFSYFLSTLPLFFGFIWAGISQEKRALHDHVAGTRVVYVDPSKKSSTGLIVGIVLIILFVGVMIVGILAAIAIPKFAELTKKSNEGASKGNLGALRSAMSIYYGDMEGQYPAELQALTTDGKYLTTIPSARTPNFHADSAAVQNFDAMIDASQSDAGGWGYVNNPKSPDWGNVFINCTHTDTRGKSWNSY